MPRKKIDYEIERYDIIVAKVVRQGADEADGMIAHMNVIKRVIGLPGDTIDIHEGAVYVNGMELDEYVYYTEPSSKISYPVVLGEDEYFILGDNRANSYDSRYFGSITGEQIQGKIIRILWHGRAKEK